MVVALEITTTQPDPGSFSDERVCFCGGGKNLGSLTLQPIRAGLAADARRIDRRRSKQRRNDKCDLQREAAAAGKRLGTQQVRQKQTTRALI